MAIHGSYVSVLVNICVLIMVSPHLMAAQWPANPPSHQQMLRFQDVFASNFAVGTRPENSLSDFIRAANTPSTLKPIHRDEANNYVSQGDMSYRSGNKNGARAFYYKALEALNIEIISSNTGLTNYKLEVNPLETDLKYAGVVLQRIEMLERLTILGSVTPVYQKAVHIYNGFFAARASIYFLEKSRNELHHIAFDQKMEMGELLRLSYNGGVFWSYILSLNNNIKNTFGIKSSLPSLPYENLAFIYASHSKSRTLLGIFSILDKFGENQLYREWYLRKLSILLLNKSRDAALADKNKINKQLFDFRHALLETETNKLYELERNLNVKAPGFMEQSPIPESKPASLMKIQSRLSRTAAILQYYITEESIYIFLVKQYGNVYIKREYNKLKILNLAVKYTTQISDGSKERPWSRNSKQLYRYLIGPVQDKLTGINKLYIIPSGELNILPFYTLKNPDTDKLLLDSFTIKYLPSAEMISIDYPNRQNNGRALIAAISNFTSTSTLTYSEAEARDVQRIYSNHADLLLQDKASKDTILKYFRIYDVVHLSTHGKFDLSDPVLSYLILKDANNNDTKIFGYELMIHPISTRLIVLSACETYLREGMELSGEEDFFGISQSLLLAGAKNVVSSMWQVGEKPTRMLMAGFYKYLNAPFNQSPAEALKSSMQQVRKVFPHPYNWSSFISYGYHD